MDNRLLRPRSKGPFRPGAPSITVAVAVNPIAWTTPNDGGAALISYRLYVNGSLYEQYEWNTQSVDAFSPGDVVAVAAVNSKGEGPQSASVVVSE